jgi:hypothetical protein
MKMGNTSYLLAHPHMKINGILLFLPSLFAKWAEDGLNSRRCLARKEGRYAQKP